MCAPKAALRGIALGLSLVLMVSACGRSDAGTSDPPSGPTPDAPANDPLTVAIQRALVDIHPAPPGLVVGVTAPGRDRYVAAFGHANTDAGLAMATDAVFGIGSVHKTFKWMVLHLLARDGALDLGDPVNDWVERPALPGVTIAHLMSHSAGLPDIVDLDQFKAAATQNTSRRFEYDEMIDLLEAAEGNNGWGSFSGGRLTGFEIGRDMSYSSYGPLIGAQIAEAATGHTIQDLVRTRIIEPLGLSQTTFMGTQPDPVQLTPGYADYDTINPFFPSAAHTSSFSSANGGAMHSTAGDLLTYVDAIFTERAFLGPETVAEMLEDPLAGSGMRSGLGLIQFDRWSATGLWGHAGYGIRSHSTTIFHAPEAGVSIVVLTNINTALDDYRTNEAVASAILAALGPGPV